MSEEVTNPAERRALQMTDRLRAAADKAARLEVELDGVSAQVQSLTRMAENKNAVIASLRHDVARLTSSLSLAERELGERIKDIERLGKANERLSEENAALSDQAHRGRARDVTWHRPDERVPTAHDGDERGRVWVMASGEVSNAHWSMVAQDTHRPEHWTRWAAREARVTPEAPGE